MLTLLPGTGLDGATLSALFAQPHNSGQSSPVCGYYSDFLALHSLQVGEPCMPVQPSPAVPAGSISGWKSPSYVCCGIFLFLGI